MSFYIFKPAIDTPETGSHYPQVQKMSHGYDYKASNSVHSLSRAYDHFPNYTPNLDYFVVHDKAKLTDLLSVAVIQGGFLISDKLKSIFDEFVIVPHRYYSAILKHNKTFYHNYYWMHIIQPDLVKNVDFNNSTFFIYHKYRDNLGNIKVTSFNEFLQKKNELKNDNPGKVVTIWAEKICLFENFDKTLDAFEIGIFDSNFYISERLNNAIRDYKITGCDISLTNNLVCD